MLLGKAAKRSCAGCERALLEPGDALTFRGDVPYGPPAPDPDAGSLSGSMTHGRGADQRSSTPRVGARPVTPRFPRQAR
jgi:hypothetical protein